MCVTSAVQQKSQENYTKRKENDGPLEDGVSSGKGFIVMNALLGNPTMSAI